LKKKIREKSNNKILIECFKEVEKNREAQNRWEIDREIYFRRNGMSEIEIKRLREESFEVVQKLSEGDAENQKQAQQNKIQDSRYDIRYRELYTREEYQNI